MYSETLFWFVNLKFTKAFHVIILVRKLDCVKIQFLEKPL